MSEIKANIFNIQHFSVNDGPGIRTVVFFKGCHLNCQWCHNPESKSKKGELSFNYDRCVMCGKCEKVCDKGVHTFLDDRHFIERKKCILCGRCTDVCNMSALKLIGKEYSIKEVMSEISKDEIFFGEDGGVTFSGGEPFGQFEALYELLKICKSKGYSTCIETSGYTSPENIIKASEYTDLFLFDCKESDEKRHKEYTGVGLEVIKNNLDMLNKTEAYVVLRCPVVPTLNDRLEHFEEIAKLAEKHKCIKAVEFMPYHPLGIEKCNQIGKESLYLNKEFADREVIEDYVSKISKGAKVPFKIN